jgi:hypothetical protein
MASQTFMYLYGEVDIQPFALFSWVIFYHCVVRVCYIF